MADDLLRVGYPEQALRDLMKRGFRLPDGRRFDGMKRLHQQMRQYRQDVFSRYDPNGIVDQIREQLDRILELERGEIDERRFPDVQTGAGSQGDEAPGAGQEPSSGEAGSDPAPSSPAGGSQGPTSPGQPGSEGGLGAASESHSGSAGQPGGSEFQSILDKMLGRKEQYLDELPRDNAGRIKGLREYDFLSSPAREAFEELVGGMQRQLMDQYFQGMKQGIGEITPQEMEAIRQMVRDMNEMLEAAQNGDMEAFDRFMDQYRDSFPESIENLDDLLQHLQRQASAMQALLDSMDPEQRAELERMMEELLRDDRLQLDLARLGHNLAAMGFRPHGGEFPFRGQETPGFGHAPLAGDAGP
jgi:uncharacterized protein with von Willebrand factor type A (vWA) domain